MRLGKKESNKTTTSMFSLNFTRVQNNIKCVSGTYSMDIRLRFPDASCSRPLALAQMRSYSMVTLICTSVYFIFNLTPTLVIYLIKFSSQQHCNTLFNLVFNLDFVQPIAERWITEAKWLWEQRVTSHWFFPCYISINQLSRTAQS